MTAVHREVASVALSAASEHGVRTASAAVEDALAAAGYGIERQDKTEGLADIFGEEMNEGLAEWVVTAPDGKQLALQMAYFDRGRDPVVMEFGPVLDLEDALGGKVAALASRAFERDYADVCAALGRYTISELIRFARRVDSGLTDRDFADAGLRLDRLSDRRLAEAGLSQQDVAVVRERFADWPRPALPPGS